MSSSKAPRLSNEIQLLLRTANICPEHAEKQLQQRAVFQMREYLRVLNHRIDRAHDAQAAESTDSEQIEQLLRAIHQTSSVGLCGAP